MSEEKNLMSIRAYAETRGVSDTAVHKAIAAGKIVHGLVKVEGKKHPKIDKAVADAEWSTGVNVNTVRSDAVLENAMDTPALTTNQPAADAGQTSTADTKSAMNNIRLDEANTRKRLLELELAEKLGTLVDKAEVDRELFAKGKEIRQNIMAVPARIIDEIMSCGSRAKAEQILSDALADALEALARNYKKAA